jgi:truncated hemoglobin YjbI
MDAEPASPASTADSQRIDMYHAVGGRDVCERLAVAFYTHVEREPLLRVLYPRHLNCPIHALTAFFIEFFGGPGEYVRWWSLSLRESHLRFAIGPQEREAWLAAMFQAIDDVNFEEPTASALRWFFADASTSLINQQSDALDESPRLEEQPTTDHKAMEIAPIRQEIAQRWQAQLLLDDTIATFRQKHSDKVLTLLASPVLQAHFSRDRAAFLSVLALLSSSAQQTLLDYVHQRLVSDPGLARERYPAGRTLLHEVAGQGSLSIVQLLLRLGADPNAADQLGQTPLYRVGNGPTEANGAEVVRVLAEKGADVNARERLKHCAPLHMAARRGNVPVAEALLECGADREARDKLGDTPLHRAVKCGKAEMVAFLLACGASIHSRGKDGMTPAQVARGPRMKYLFQTARA